MSLVVLYLQSQACTRGARDVDDSQATAPLGQATWVEEEEEVYICSSRLGLIKMDHPHSGNGRNSQQ
jgi:hypothetical protein